MFKRKPKMRRKWLVNYSIPNGIGRHFLNTDDKPLTEELIRGMDDWLRDVCGEELLFVTSAVPLELIANEAPLTPPP